MQYVARRLLEGFADHALKPCRTLMNEMQGIEQAGLKKAGSAYVGPTGLHQILLTKYCN